LDHCGSFGRNEILITVNISPERLDYLPQIICGALNEIV
jgi:hypothetical protein